MQLLPSLLGTRLVSGFSSSTPCTNYHVGTAGSTGETICPMLRSRIVDYLTVQMRQTNERNEAAERSILSVQRSRSRLGLYLQSQELDLYIPVIAFTFPLHTLLSSLL